MVSQVKPRLAYRRLHVALIVKNAPASFARADRNMGMFSYAVREFTWKHISPGKGVSLHTRPLREQGFDLVFHEDGGAWCEYKGGALPTVYYAIDSTLSDDNHFQPRFEQARKADLVLVDHDELERFEPCGKPVRRLSYCVNDKVFHPEPKTLDVCFHCGGSETRGYMRRELSEMCQARGLSYRSGAVSLQEYAADMNRAKVVVNIPRNPRNRPHRIFDAMASRAAVVTAPIPPVSGEARKAGRQYIEADCADIPDLARILVENNTWSIPATMGYEWVQAHTWAARARELRQLLSVELGI